MEYLLERRRALGGFLPQRRRKATQSLEVPKLATYERLLKATGEREISTTMAFVQMLNITLRDKTIGPRCVPIVADEARTFGMEGLFRQIGIYAPHGQKYKPRSEEHTSELQSLMRISYAVFCLKKKKEYMRTTNYSTRHNKSTRVNYRR